MKKGRLLKLAALLERVPARKFDMDVWGESKKPAYSEPQCATKACALGWATAIPEFHRAGLHLVAACHGCTSAEVLYRDNGLNPGAEFFGLSEDEEHFLFYAGAETPKAKAREIREFVRTGVIPE